MSARLVDADISRVLGRLNYPLLRLGLRNDHHLVHDIASGISREVTECAFNADGIKGGRAHARIVKWAVHAGPALRPLIFCCS